MLMNKKERIGIIDFFRGFLIIGMVIFHLGYTISEIYHVDINFFNPVTYYLQLIGLCLFIFLCGIASNYSKSNLKRGIIMLSLGMLITVVTYFYNPNFYIKFGVLHFLGCATIIYHFYRKFNYQMLLFWLFISITITLVIREIEINNPFLFPLGLPNDTFLSSDYVPLFGFIIPFIIGNIIGKYIKDSNWHPTILSNNLITKVGRHGLIIYLLHQPIIIGILYFIL